MAAAGIRRILLGTDLSRASEAASNQAIDLANDLSAELVILHVTAEGMLQRGLDAGREQEARALTQRARDTGIRTTFLTWPGDPGQSIVDAARGEEADLIVVGSHGRGTMGRLLLGSVSQHVVANARCPVLVSRPEERR